MKRKPLETWQTEDAARLKALFGERAAMSQEKFGQTYGIGSQGAVWQYLEGRIPLNLTVALKFAKGLGISLGAISPTLATHLPSEETHNSANKSLAAAQPSGTYDAAPSRDIHRQAPLISWVRAGEFEEAEDNMLPGEAERWFPVPKRCGPHTYVLRVEGDSMTAAFGKSYPAGSFIIVDPDLKSPVSGQRIIAKLEGSNEVTFKAFVQEAGRTFLRPLNPQYPPIHEPFKVIGTVIGKWEDD